MTKQYALHATALRPYAPNRGGCLATDAITVDGRKVGFCYRSTPLNDLDSGWRFFAGDETDEYIADLSHSAVYDINTIANYDPEIIPFLDAPVGAAFERGEGWGPLAPVHDFELPV